MSAKQRTEIQRTADSIDCHLFRVISNVERMQETHKRDHGAKDAILNCLIDLKRGRTELRTLMHPDDRAVTR